MSATNADTASASTASFVSALIIGLVMVGVYTTAFIILRPMKKFQGVYESRRMFAVER
jgi:hypothetical protein